MPLRCCEDCGWAFTGPMRDAIELHRSECPSCAGTPELAFSDPQSRGRPAAPLGVHPGRPKAEAAHAPLDSAA